MASSLGVMAHSAFRHSARDGGVGVQGRPLLYTNLLVIYSRQENADVQGIGHKEKEQ